MFCLYININAMINNIDRYFFTENVKIEKERYILVNKHMV